MSVITPLPNVSGINQTYEYAHRTSDPDYHYYDKWSNNQWVNTSMFWGAHNKTEAIKYGKNPAHADFGTWLDAEPSSTNYQQPKIVAVNGANIELQDSNGIVFYAFADPYLSSPGPTVTEITINDPPDGPYNTGMGGSYYLDGEVVSNDTILASDITLYKDFQPYSNSNITMHGNHFSLTKSGDGLYLIECGGVNNVLYYKDESWLSTISSSSSSRSVNASRIRNLLATIPSNIEGYMLQFITDIGGPGSRPGTGSIDQVAARWKTMGRWNFSKISTTDTKVSWMKHFTNGSHWISNPWNWLVVFELGNISNEIKWRIKQYKWFHDLSLNHSALTHEFASPWFEVGAHPRARWYWNYEQNSTLDDEDGNPVSNYDSWLADERNYFIFYDWIYYEEPEGDDQGPDGNPPYNVPPNNPVPAPPPTSDNEPKNPYPGDKYPRRRRAHSFW